MPVARAAARRGGGQRARESGRYYGGKPQRFEQSRDPEHARSTHGRQHRVNELANVPRTGVGDGGGRGANTPPVPGQFRAGGLLYGVAPALYPHCSVRGGGPYAAAVETPPEAERGNWLR